MNTLKKLVAITLGIFLSLTLFLTTLFAGELEKRVEHADAVVKEMMGIPEKAIPYNLFTQSQAIAIFPHTLKGGFIFGGTFGKGIICVRDADTGVWSPPAFFTVGGGSFGFQAGIEAIDLVLLIMTQRGVEGLLKSKVKLGGDIGVATGPVGRRFEAGTDVLLNAEILSYSRSKGLFAGVSIEGATIVEDKDANRAFYGEELMARAIVLEKKAMLPEAAQRLINTLQTITESASTQ